MGELYRARAEGADRDVALKVVRADLAQSLSPQAILDAVTSPEDVEYQPDTDTVKYTGPDATVVLNQAGQVVTTWATSSGGWRQ